MHRLFDAFSKAGKELFLVGGAVRDLALGIPMKDLDDLDFCSNARPAESLEILQKNGFSTYDMGFEFGTVGATLKGPKSEGFPKDVQVTTYRSAEYYRRGSRHPVVKFGDTIDQDLGRRDFSINSIAMDANHNYFDPYNGIRDLEDGILRVIGDPHETLKEDPLRILRIARFVSRFGFDVDPALHKAAHDQATFILDISHERWLIEMNKMLVGKHVRKALHFMREIRVLGIILPEVAALIRLHERDVPADMQHKDVWDHTIQVIEQTPADPTLRWGALLHDVGKAWTRGIIDGAVTFRRHEQQGAMLFDGIAKRFMIDNDTAKRVKAIVANHGRIPQYEGEWSDAAVRRLVRELDPYVDELVTFARADLTTRFPEKREAAHARIDELRERIDTLTKEDTLRPQLPTGIGQQIMTEFGLKPSELVGKVKLYLEEEIIEGRLESGADPTVYLSYLRDHGPFEDLK